MNVYRAISCDFRFVENFSYSLYNISIIIMNGFVFPPKEKHSNGILNYFQQEQREVASNDIRHTSNIIYEFGARILPIAATTSLLYFDVRERIYI